MMPRVELSAKDGLAVPGQSVGPSLCHALRSGQVARIFFQSGA